ncbi:MAG: uracil-DNA glycosylase [Desulfobacterales bacterium]|nr:uracil-DNA glycosylase [Desulfobacterales bacterium]
MKPTCHKCLHYHITWDKDRPHGCLALRFKSRRLPIEAVRASTPGMDCQMFSEKKKKVRR